MLLLTDYLLQQCSLRPARHCLKIDFSGVATWSTRSRSGAAAATGKAPSPFYHFSLSIDDTKQEPGGQICRQQCQSIGLKKKKTTPAFTHDFLSFVPLSSEDSAPESFNKLFIIPKRWWKEGCASGKSGNRFSSILSTPWKHFSLLLLLLQTSYAYVNQAKHQINLSSCGWFTLIQSLFYSSNMFGNP